MNPITCTNNELTTVVSKLKAEGKRASTISVTPDGYRLTVCYERPAQGELDALLADPNVLPSQREAITRMLSASVEHEASR